MTDYYLTNKPIGDTYDTVEFGVIRAAATSSEPSPKPNVALGDGNSMRATGPHPKAVRALSIGESVHTDS